MQSNAVSRPEKTKIAPTKPASERDDVSVLQQLITNRYHTLTESVHRENLEVLHELASHQPSECCVAR